MAPSSTGRRVAKIFLFLLVTVCLTVLGMVLSWIQVHSPGWRGKAAFVLLLPFALVNWIFAAIHGHGSLSRPLYYTTLVVGTLGQLAYYFAVFTLMKRFASALRRRPNHVS